LVEPVGELAAEHTQQRREHASPLETPVHRRGPVEEKPRRFPELLPRHLHRALWRAAGDRTGLGGHGETGERVTVGGDEHAETLFEARKDLLVHGSLHEAALGLLGRGEPDAAGGRHQGEDRRTVRWAGSSHRDCHGRDSPRLARQRRICPAYPVPARRSVR
jgi:hypothetical protein